MRPFLSFCMSDEFCGFSMTNFRGITAIWLVGSGSGHYFGKR